VRKRGLELGPGLLARDHDHPRAAQPPQLPVDELGNLLQVVVDELVDVPLEPRLRPAALVVPAGRVVELVDELLELPAPQAEQVAALAPDEHDERALAPADERDQRGKRERVTDLDDVGHTRAQRQRLPEVVERRAEDRQPSRPIAVEVLFEERPQALHVAAQAFLLLVVELGPPRRLGALDLVDQRVHASRQVGRRRRRAGVEVEVETDRAAILRPKAREIAETVPRHCRSHEKPFSEGGDSMRYRRSLKRPRLYL